MSPMAGLGHLARYQISFNPSWLIRPARADVRRPKAGSGKNVSTPVKFGW